MTIVPCATDKECLYNPALLHPSGSAIDVTHGKVTMIEQWNTCLIY